MESGQVVRGEWGVRGAFPAALNILFRASGRLRNTAARPCAATALRQNAYAFCPPAGVGVEPPLRG